MPVQHSDAPPHPADRGGDGLDSNLVHNAFTQGMELRRGFHWLSEEIGYVVSCAHEGHVEFERFHHVAHKELMLDGAPAVHDHCLGQGLPELTSETQIGFHNYQ